MRVDIFPPYVRIEVHASVPPEFPILHGKVGPCQMSSRFNAAQPILFEHRNPRFALHQCVTDAPILDEWSAKPEAIHMSEKPPMLRLAPSGLLGDHHRLAFAPDSAPKGARIQVEDSPLPRQFDVVIERDEEGYYIASVPQLPGCHTQARSLDEVTQRIREAVELCLEVAGAPEQTLEFVGIQRITIAA